MNRRGFIILIVISILIPVAGDAADPRPVDVHLNDTLDIWVDALGSYNYYWNNIPEDYIIHIDIEVTSGNDIDFYIVDEENYDLWLDNQNTYAEFLQENVGSVSESFTVPTSGEWHLLFINDNWLYRKHIEGTVTVTAPYVPNDPSGVTAVGIAISLGVLLLIIGAFAYNRKKKQQRDIINQPSPHYTPPLSRSPQQTGYCSYCGHMRQGMDVSFCAKCGRAFEGPGFQ